jgi:hypothetical protein
MFNGIVTLSDATTPEGWSITSDRDIVLALMGMPYFATVATPFIEDAVEQSARDRRDYDNVRDLAQHIAENYI